MDISKFKSKTKIQIRYADLDTYGHVNNKAYLSFLEEARIQYIKDLKLESKITIFDFGAVVGRIDIKYLYPIQYSDEVWAYTRCSRLGNKSYDLENLIVINRGDKNIIAAHALVTMVSYDLKKGQSKPLDPDLVEIVNNFEIEKPLQNSKK